MNRQGQRYRQHASTLALSAFLGLAAVLSACSSSIGSPAENADAASAPEAETNTATPDETVPEDAEDTDQSNGLPDDLVVPPPSTETAVEFADLSIAADLPGLIAYRADNGDLVTSRPDGTAQTVWASGDEFTSSQPTWSSSGEQLAWTAIGTDEAFLATAATSSADPSTINFSSVASPLFYLSWSPGDSWIAGLGNGPGGIEFSLFDTAGGGQQIVGPGQPFFTDWSSDATLVAAIGGQALVDITAADQAAVARNLSAPLGAFSAPIAISESEAIVALRDNANNEVVRLDGSSGSVLANADGPVAMSLNPQATHVAVLVIGRPDDSVETISFAQPAAPSLPSGVVSIIDLETGEVVSRPERDILAMRWSPDGAHLALLQSSSAGLTWLFADPTTTSTTTNRSVPFLPSREFANAYLPFADQYDRSTTEWSPDSTAFVFSGTIDGTEGVFVDVIDDELGPAQLGNGDIAFWSPAQ